MTDEQIARDIAHRFLRCRGGTGTGPGGDGPRWHTRKCDQLTFTIEAALDEARNARPFRLDATPQTPAGTAGK